MNTTQASQSLMKALFRFFVVVGIIVAIIAGILGIVRGGTARAANGVPRPDHVVIVIEENHDYNQIIGNGCCPYIAARAAAGALMTNSHGIGHPSQPNYLHFFAGSNFGVTDSACPLTFNNTPNLGSELIAAGFTFGSYSESLPATGSTVCTAAGGYARKHNPWVNFPNVPASTNMTMNSFPTDFNQLPTVSIVIPNLCNDMHDCDPSIGDGWLQTKLNNYIQWAKTHNSLFILTFDEDNNAGGNNRVVTIFEGPMVVPGQYNNNINHHNMLRTLEDMYDLSHAGNSVNVSPITNIWVGPATHTFTPTLTPTHTYTPTKTPTPEEFTFTPTPTPTISPTGTVTDTPTITLTPVAPTKTFTRTPTPTGLTGTPYTPDPTPSRTFTPSTPGPTSTRTNTPTPTRTFTPIWPTSTPYTPGPTYTRTNTSTPTWTPTPTRTFTPFVPTSTPYTYTPGPSPTRTFTPTLTRTHTPTPIP